MPSPAQKILATHKFQTESNQTSQAEAKHTIAQPPLLHLTKKWFVSHSEPRSDQEARTIRKKRISLAAFTWLPHRVIPGRKSSQHKHKHKTVQALKISRHCCRQITPFFLTTYSKREKLVCYLVTIRNSKNPYVYIYVYFNVRVGYEKTIV